MKNRLWGKYIHHVIGKQFSQTKASRLLTALLMWEARSPGSARLLEELTRALSLPSWMALKEDTRPSLLTELLRIDNGRQGIVPWLVSLVRHENDPYLLFTISNWQEKHKIITPVLWEAWCERMADISPRIREVAWERILFSPPVELPAASEVESTGIEPAGRTLEVEIRIAELVDRHLPDEFDPAVLEVIAGWQPSPWLPVGLCARLVTHWEEKLQTGSPQGRRNILPVLPGIFDYRRFTTAIWRGLMTMAALCPGAEATVENLIKTRLSAEMTYNELWEFQNVLPMMAAWRPPDGQLPLSLARLWSRLLLALPPEATDRLEKNVEKNAWLALGEKRNEDEPHSVSLDAEVWDNCLSALEAAFKSSFSSKWDSIEDLRRLSSIMPPSGMSPAQQVEWQSRWMTKLTHPDQRMRQAAAMHLIRFGNPSLPGGEDLRMRLVSVVETLSPSVPRDVSDWRKSLETIEKHQWGEARPWGFFCDIWQRLFRFGDAWWKETGITILAARLHPELPEEDRSCLHAFWLSLLGEETDPALLSAMGRMWHRPGMLPETLRQEMLPLWKKLATHVNPQIRASAWDVLVSTGDEVGEFLVNCLATENAAEVLSVMSRWRPSPAFILSSGFQEFRERLWEGWDDVLSRPESKGKFEYIVTNLIENNLLRLAVSHPGGPRLFQHALNRMKTVCQPSSQRVREIIDDCQRKVDFLVSLESPPEVFHHQLDTSAKLKLGWEIIKQYGIPNTFSPHLSGNLFLLSAAVLRDFLSPGYAPKQTFGNSVHDHIKEHLRFMHQLLQGEGIHHAGTPDGFDLGWQYLRGILTAPSSMNREVVRGFSELLRFHLEFPVFVRKDVLCQVLDEVRQTPGHPKAQMMNLALWREVCSAWAAWEMAGSGPVTEGGPGKEVDPVAGRRWLREWIHTFCPGSQEMPSNDHPSDHRVPAFGRLLWETMEPELTQGADKRRDFPAHRFCPPGVERSFRLLLKTGEMADDVRQGSRQPVACPLFPDLV